MQSQHFVSIHHPNYSAFEYFTMESASASSTLNTPGDCLDALPTTNLDEVGLHGAGVATA
jgi:hypothetical protein